MLYEIDVMLLKTFGGIEGYFLFTMDSLFSNVIFLILYSGNFVMSDKVIVFFFTHSEVMVAHSSFISNLLGNKLSVMSCWNTFIYKLLLFRCYH